MDQNKTRKMAIVDIEALLKEKKPKSFIDLAIMQKYGLSAKFVERYLLKLQELGLVKLGTDNQILYD